MAGGHENLVSLADRTTEEQRAIASKGGHASVAARREKKTFRETMEICLQELVERKDKNGSVLEKITAQQAICLKQIAKAMAGDTTAAKYCTDTVTPKQVELTGRDGAPLEQTVRYINPSEYKAVQKHIDEIVGDVNDDPDSK